MRSARLRQHITFQKKVRSKSELGQSTHKWVDVLTASAEVKPFPVASGSTYNYKNDHFLDESKHLITLRWRPDIKPSKAHRIVCEGDIYEISGIENYLNRNREWRIATRKVD